MKEKYGELQVQLTGESEKAICVTLDHHNDDEEHWIPKSVLSHSEREMNDWTVGDSVALRVAQWFIDKEELA